MMEIPLSVFFRFFQATPPRKVSGKSFVLTFYEQLNAAMGTVGLLDTICAVEWRCGISETQLHVFAVMSASVRRRMQASLLKL
jgi:hypothetical protein